MTRPRVVETALPLHVTEHPGPPDSAETFLLVHGYGGSSYSWHPWVPALCERGRVLLVDPRGGGRAPKPDDGRYGAHDLADRLVELVRELDLRQLTVAGHSLGGGLSLLTALRLLDADEPRLARLVLVAAAAYPQRLPPFVGLSKVPWPTDLMARTVPFRSLIAGVLRSIVHDPATVSAEQIDAYTAPFLEAEGVRAAMDVGRRIVPPDLESLAARYDTIETPTLLIWGDSDRVVPRSVGERLAAALPRARREVIPRCGHVPVEEHPEATLGILLAFLDGTPLPAR